MKTIMIIEDDPAILLGLNTMLEEDNYKLISCSDGKDGFKQAKTIQPDLLILDIMLPNKNGLDICRDLRLEKYDFPILMLTSKKDEIDKVLGFEIGADDYVTKPFSLIELKMRIKAILRRTSKRQESKKNICFANIILETKKMDAIKNDIALGLSAKEFQILKYLAEREGEVVSRDNLLDDIWGYDNFPSTRTVDNYILNIRKKIEEDPSDPKHLITIHTVGYKFLK